MRNLKRTNLAHLKVKETADLQLRVVTATKELNTEITKPYVEQVKNAYVNFVAATEIEATGSLTKLINEKADNMVNTLRNLDIYIKGMCYSPIEDIKTKAETVTAMVKQSGFNLNTNRTSKLSCIQVFLDLAKNLDEDLINTLNIKPILDKINSDLNEYIMIDDQRNNHRSIRKGRVQECKKAFIKSLNMLVSTIENAISVFGIEDYQEFVNRYNEIIISVNSMLESRSSNKNSEEDLEVSQDENLINTEAPATQAEQGK
ncbi:MAG: DUF6261 family protein [Bacteroidales bacterium]|nr:DUF6261 family protein [Bacteroidales bacterium]